MTTLTDPSPSEKLGRFLLEFRNITKLTNVSLSNYLSRYHGIKLRGNAISDFINGRRTCSLTYCNDVIKALKQFPAYVSYQQELQKCRELPSVNAPVIQTPIQKESGVSEFGESIRKFRVKHALSYSEVCELMCASGIDIQLDELQGYVSGNREVSPVRAGAIIRFLDDFEESKTLSAPELKPEPVKTATPPFVALPVMRDGNTDLADQVQRLGLITLAQQLGYVIEIKN